MSPVFPCRELVQRRQWPEGPATGAQKSHKELEQHQSRRLNGHDQSLEPDNQNIAQDENYPGQCQRVRCGCQAYDSQRQATMRQGERADADERNRVYDELQQGFEQLSSRST